MNRAWLPTVAAAGLVLVSAFTAACGSSNPKPQIPAAKPAPAAAAARGRSAAPASRSHHRSDRRLAAAFRRRRARAQARAPRAGAESSSTGRSRCCSSRRMAPGRTPACGSTSTGWSTASTRTRSRALAQGDGFAEKKSEPASIDEILKIATFPKPTPAAADRKDRQGRPRATEHDVPIPQNERVLAYVELFQGRLARLHPGEPDARHEVPADDPGRVPRRRAAARSRLHPGHRKRVQDQRAVEGERARARGSS